MGTKRFVLLYAVALMLSEARTYLQRRNEPSYASLGASGAISAVLFAAIVYFPAQSLFIIPIGVGLLFSDAQGQFSPTTGVQARN